MRAAARALDVFDVLPVSEPRVDDKILVGFDFVYIFLRGAVDDHDPVLFAFDRNNRGLYAARAHDVV